MGSALLSLSLEAGLYHVHMLSQSNPLHVLARFGAQQVGSKRVHTSFMDGVEAKGKTRASRVEFAGLLWDVLLYLHTRVLPVLLLCRMWCEKHPLHAAWAVNP